jgi:probable DNA repair protein
MPISSGIHLVPDPVTPDQLWPLLDAARGATAADTWLVCASNRLAQHWLAQDAGRQQAQGRRVWMTAPIQTMDRFLRQLYEQAGARQADAQALPRLLSQAQERALWRAVVDEDLRKHPLLRANEAAVLAGEAWTLIHQWQLPRPMQTRGVADQERFQTWARRFEARCRSLPALEPARLPAMLQQQIAQGRLRLPARLILAGFDQITPAFAAVLAAAHEQGCELRKLPAIEHAGKVTRRSAADGERELRAAASWARAQLEPNPERQPGLSIGIVVPDLAARRADVQRIFDEVLCPEAQAMDAAAARPYNLSLGEPLADQPLLQCALRLLQLLAGALPCAEATALLLSPYWGGAEPERLARAGADIELRNAGHLEAGLAELLKILPRVPQSAAFSTRCQQLHALQRGRERLLPAQWAERFAAWLEIAGWPGPRPLNSSEHQVLRAWSELLAELGRMGAVLPRLTLTAATQQLRELAKNQVFQPQTTEVQVQVLGVLETSGLDFDRLWVLGLDDQRWPRPSRPNPFIPAALQRERGLPRASAQRELEYATQLTRRLQLAAPDVIFSHAREEEGRELQPSPLILHLPESAPAEAASVPDYWHCLQQSRQIEALDDTQGAPPEGALRGGIALFADQAKCPFRAYATHRLGARALEEPAYGPTALDRGNLVHRALESLWRQLLTHAALLALGEEAQAALIDGCVDQALGRLQAEAPQRLSPAWRELESRRLGTLLENWLQIERARSPFSVHATEGRLLSANTLSAPTEFGAEVEGIPVKLRADRIDALPGGGHLIIDYKTGKTDASPWAQQRPEEPQLLIYALASYPEIPVVGAPHGRDGQTEESRAWPAPTKRAEGIAYAHVRAAKPGLRGVAADEGLGGDIKRYDKARDLKDCGSWDELLGRWREELRLLAGEIRAGDARVQPKHAQTCRLCDLHSVCRIREQPGIEEDAA